MIGETAEVGDDVTMYQGVTLGGTGFARGKRHPTVGDQVMIGSGAKLLGPIDGGRALEDRRQLGGDPRRARRTPPSSATPGIRCAWTDAAPEGPDADWAHLPDPVADAIGGLANRLTELEELVAEQTGRKPGRRRGQAAGAPPRAGLRRWLGAQAGRRRFQ